MCAAVRRSSDPRLADSSGLLDIRNFANAAAHGPHKGSMDAHISSNGIWRQARQLHKSHV